MKWDCNKMADEFVSMIREHHPDSDGQGFDDLMGCVIADVIIAVTRNGSNPDMVIAAAFNGVDLMQNVDTHTPIKVIPGIYDDEPEPETFDDALARKGDAAALADAREGFEMTAAEKLMMLSERALWALIRAHITIRRAAGKLNDAEGMQDLSNFLAAEAWEIERNRP